MEFDKGELKILLAAALSKGPEGHARLSEILALFRRPGEARRLVGRLGGSGFVAVDALSDKLWLLERPVLTALGLLTAHEAGSCDPPAHHGQGELLVNERPLAAA